MIAGDRQAGIIGSAACMLEVFKTLGMAAGNHLSVLLTGETGVGKDVAARLIHDYSSRSAAPFVGINTTAIPASLFEAELFGYAAGAFTGARQDTVGRIESAAGGTLFLDEIGDLPAISQAKLLRFLEDRTFSRLGESGIRQVDVRLVAATNQNLSTQVEQGLFRQDLYYRLAQIPIEIPPLRCRVEDIPLLVEHFILAASQDLQLPVAGITGEALQQALRYDWPGNIRELRNAVYRSVARQETGQLEQLDLHARLDDRTGSGAEAGLAQLICAALQEGRISQLSEGFQQQVTLLALEHYQGNKSRVAQALGISRNTLRSRLRAYGCEPDAWS